MTTALPPTGLWNKQDAADYLGIAVNTLNHWICDRKIPYVKIGSLVRFRKTDLDRFIVRNLRRESSHTPSLERETTQHEKGIDSHVPSVNIESS